MIVHVLKLGLAGLMVYGLARVLAPEKETPATPATPAPAPTQGVCFPHVRLIEFQDGGRGYYVVKLPLEPTQTEAQRRFEVRRADALDVWLIFDGNGDVASSGDAEDLALLRADLPRFPKNMFAATPASATSQA